MPGCMMAAARHNRPTIIVYGGTIQPGVRQVDCPNMGFKKGENMIEHEAEIFSRPARTWFQTGEEKAQAEGA